MLNGKFTLFYLLKPKKHNCPKLCKMLIKGLTSLVISVWLEVYAIICTGLNGPFQDSFHYLKSTCQTN